MTEPSESISHEVHEDGPQRAMKKRVVLIRVLLVLGLLVGIYAIGKASGFLDNVDVPTLRRLVDDAGAWGFLLFVALFAVGVLLQLPGMLFVATGILVYGKSLGYVACLSGAIVAVCASFAMVRVVGGQALSSIERPVVKRILKRLDKHPIRWLVVLRLVMFISPPLNYALALTRLRFRDYALGSALGLVTPMLIVTLFFDWLFTTPWIQPLLFG